MPMEYHVERVELEQQDTAVVRGSVPHDGIAAFIGGAFGEVMAVLGAQGLTPAAMPFARYAIVEGGFEIEAGFPTDRPVQPSGRVVASTLPGGPAVLVLHRGPYSGVADAYDAAMTWLAENSWTMTGPPWEAYLDGPEVAEPRTIVHVPCRPS